MKKSLYLLGLLLVCGIYQACAPEDLPGSIYGTVVDKATGEPIKSAGVELSPSGLKTVTGSEGQFEFANLTPGSYTLLITKTGYLDYASSVITVLSAQQAKGDVQIEKLPPALKVVDDNRQEISTLDFGSAEADVARSFSLFNDGTESLEWQITTTAEWIKSVSKIEGVLSAGATQSLIVTIDRVKLSSGENTTTVHITSNSGNKQLVVTATNNFQVTKLNVLPTTAITSTSATLNGEVVEDGSPIYTERGFVYAETTQPTIDNAIQKITVPFTDDKTFSAAINNLTLGKKYYVRTYAVQAGREVYSTNEVSFTAEGSVLPKVITKSATDISRSEGKAIAMGMVTEVGDPVYSERGFVYGTTHNPIIQNATKVKVEGSGLGEYFTTLSDLQLGNIYYVRAYATNTVGVAYGEEQLLDFNPILPVVVTNEVTDISAGTKSATFHATITNAGDPVYTERGFVYGKSPNPTTDNANIITIKGNSKGTYDSEVQNLDANQTYYVRAYVVSTIGVTYGEQVEFILSTLENGHEWVDLGLSVKWATCNIGAYKPEDYGGYFSWGETTTKTYYSWDYYKYWEDNRGYTKYYYDDGNIGIIDNKFVLDKSDDAASELWGGNWRMPTATEIVELIEKCTCIVTTQNGIKGFKIISKSNGNYIFLPAAAERCFGEYLEGYGAYWSSSLALEEGLADLASTLLLSDATPMLSEQVRICGLSVRPVCL
ncbi:MAG: carboxypeptidase regulatory-like domain-containing protein [Paludibacteraceae bacterium]|nr:carboxypeptidase regulatory-like domain-containing protein [Paludibacteraceae bacterium]